MGATGIVVSGNLYGGLHIIAWKSISFSSSLEEDILLCRCWWWPLHLRRNIRLGYSDKVKTGKSQNGIMRVLVYVSVPLCLASFLLYLVIRVYLVFEVFRNLAFLDPQIYSMPNVSAHPPALSTLPVTVPGYILISPSQLLTRSLTSIFHVQWSVDSPHILQSRYHRQKDSVEISR